MADWESIVRETVPLAFESAWRVLGVVEDSEDAVQNALVDALEFSRRHAVRSWPALVRRLATCRALDLLRARRVDARLDADAPGRSTEDPSCRAIERELQERLRVALAQLSPREAEVFSLRYFADLSNSRIAAELGMTPSAVGVALHGARARLKQSLKENES